MTKVESIRATREGYIRKPDWIRVKAPTSKGFSETRKLMRDLKLNTVCEEAACPNIGECWEKKHSTVMILGEICTRACAFCNIKTGMPNPVDPMEPINVATACGAMGMEHIVITSVDRDDLEDGGADQFVKVIKELREHSPNTTIEIPTIRPGARYYNSLRLLDKVKEMDPSIFTKSGIMVGLGEEKSEIYEVMDDMRSANIDFLTIGQYLQPTPRHAELKRYVTPDEFKAYEQMARGKGFLLVSATPLTRSSYHAGDDFKRLRESREAKLKKVKL